MKVEASEAQTAAPAGQEGQEGGGEGQGAEGGVDLSAINERLDSFGETLQDIGERFQSLQGQGGQPQPEGDPGYAGEPQWGYDEFGNPIAGQAGGLPDTSQLYGPDGSMDPAQAQQYLQGMVGQAVGPLAAELKEMKVRSSARDLMERHPELKQHDVAAEVWNAVQDRAVQIGRPDLATEAGFVELVYMARKASEAAQQEVPAGAGPQEAVLEGGGGAAPGATEPSLGERMRNAGGGTSPGHALWLGRG